MGVGTVEEEIDAGDVPIDETNDFESRLGRVEIGTKDQHVHVLREAHSRLIDPPHPGGNRIASDDSVCDTCIFQRRSRAQQTALDQFHGSDRPLPGLQAQR